MPWKMFLHDFGVANLGFVMPSLSGIKFSEAIRKGDALGYKETRTSYTGCAIGTAYRYKTGKDLKWNAASGLAALRGDSSKAAFCIRNAVAIEFNVPYNLVRSADRMHRDGVNRLDVASWLERQGY